MATTERRGLRERGRSPATGPATPARPAAKRGAWKGRWPRRRREADEAETTATAAAGRLRTDRAAAAGARTGTSAAMENCLCGSFPLLVWPAFAASSLVSPLACSPAPRGCRARGPVGFMRASERPMTPVMPEDNVSRARLRGGDDASPSHVMDCRFFQFFACLIRALFSHNFISFQYFPFCMVIVKALFSSKKF